ncbi:MAG: hypothetical protein ACXVIF_06465 [Halobacteriota archaeon]
MVIEVIAATLPAWYTEWINLIWTGVAGALGAGFFGWAGWLITLAFFI